MGKHAKQLSVSTLVQVISSYRLVLLPRWRQTDYIMELILKVYHIVTHDFVNILHLSYVQQNWMFRREVFTCSVSSHRYCQIIFVIDFNFIFHTIEHILKVHYPMKLSYVTMWYTQFQDKPFVVHSMNWYLLIFTFCVLLTGWKFSPAAATWKCWVTE